MLKRSLTACSLLALLLMVGAAPASAETAKKSTEKTKCDLTFSLSEWAAVYEHATGTGTITCENGQTANVAVTSKGVGLTAGKFKIDGKGEFSKVKDIADLFGGYAAAEGDAGLVKAGETALVTKGDVTLAIAGHGEGWNVGVSLGQFKLTPMK
jgi:hypothetical protein